MRFHINKSINGLKNMKNSGDENGLVDRRGKIELTSKDKDQIEMRKLKKDNERLRMENDFLKKLQELERGGF